MATRAAPCLRCTPRGSYPRPLLLLHLLTSTNMLVLVACDLPFSSHASLFPPVFIRICPVLGTLLLPCSVDLCPHLLCPPFVQNRSIGPYPVHRVIHAPVLSVIAPLFDYTTPSSFRLLLNVCTCTDPHAPPTNTINFTFHLSPSLSVFPATFSRLLISTSS